MSKNLVIVESPAKGKTIEKFLGADYKVVASMGHIRDLPKKSLWVDIEKDFFPEYEINSDKKKTVDNLKKLKKTHPQVWIATDEDREWEAIWWHLCHILDLDPKETKRIVFHEITKKAITDSIKNPRNIDMWLVDAQQARRILDRLVGYKVSPVLWSKIRKWLSAGRVQSVAVKMIVEREREIKVFKPEESWKLSMELKEGKIKFDTFFHKLWGKVKKLKSEEDVKKMISTLYNNLEEIKVWEDKKWNKLLSKTWKLEFKLVDNIKKDSSRMPGAPFTTSTLQQEASRKCGYWVKQTMMIAQKLYEWVDLGGWEREWLITYMRTDSVNLSEDAKKQSKNMIEKIFGKEYSKTRNYKTKSSSAQEAHEAIRPVNISRTPDSLKGVLSAQELKIYDLIWKRTVASQMTEALVETTTYVFNPLVSDTQEWITKWEVIKFDWFMKLYIESNDDEENPKEDNQKLPNLNIGDIISGEELKANQIFSRPPARYTEASLVKKLESEWIGRPSTYAPTISTIIDRGYIEKLDKKYLHPTDIAFTVNDFLEQYFTQMMDYKFTSNVEAEFDLIAEWKEAYQTMLTNFWDGSLKKDIEKAKWEAEKVVEKVWKKCPKCDNDLVYKYSKWGKFIGCSGFPECDYIDKPEEEKAELKALQDKYEWKPCPEGGTIVVKVGRFGPFLASSEYPKIKRIGKIKDPDEELLEEILAEKWMLIDEETWEELVIKNSRRGKFLAAKNYPKVKIAKPIPKVIWDEVKKRKEELEEE